MTEDKISVTVGGLDPVQEVTANSPSVEEGVRIQRIVVSTGNNGKRRVEKINRQLHGGRTAADTASS